MGLAVVNPLLFVVRRAQACVYVHDLKNYVQVMRVSLAGCNPQDMAVSADPAAVQLFVVDKDASMVEAFFSLYGGLMIL